jgi:hypothetical protein
MRVEAFVPDWPGPKQHAKENAAVIGQFCPVTILNDPNDYFNAQWQKARQQFTGDVLLWAMADVDLPTNFGEMYQEMTRIMARPDTGWWAPDVAWTCYIYDRQQLPAIEPGVHEVPNTDSLLFAIKADVIKKMPVIDPKLCFMWGLDVVAISTVRSMGLKAVRDYRFKAGHPNNTGYNIEKASVEMGKLFDSLTPEFRSRVKSLIDEINRMKRL